MSRSVLFAVCIALLCTGALQAQAQFSIRAASDEAVPGWNRIDFENHPVWVSPTVSLTSADIARAEESRFEGAGTAVKVFFTDAGAQKMRALTTAQMNKLVAVMLDGTLVFAPRVRAELSKEAYITGKAPDGLARSEVQRLLSSLNQK